MCKSVICDLLQIFKSSVSAVLPENLIRRSVKYNSKEQQLAICGNIYLLNDRNVYLVGSGKAVQRMAAEVETILSSKISKGIISIPVGCLKTRSDTVAYFEGAKNNLPDKNAEDTSRKIKELANGLTKEDLLIVLISGGGSALLSLPKPPITLKEKTFLVKKLANCGADIIELNTVRKRISDIKGGKLAIYAQPAEVVSLILSDIVGDPIDLIASGPTVENTDNQSKASNILHKYNIINELPDSIKEVLKAKDKSGHFPKDNVKNYVIGSNKLSIKAAVEEAKNLNYVTVELSNTVTGDVNNIAEEYAKLTGAYCKFLNGSFNLEDLQSFIKNINIPGIQMNMETHVNLQNKNLCLILGGEITVEVKGSGKGGRNQHLALEYSKNIYKSKEEFVGYEIYFLSAGTDGIDGPTDAAGAIGCLDLVPQAREQKLNLDKYLENNDSYNFYKEFRKGDLHVVTGHTGTNVMDIHLILIKKISNPNRVRKTTVEKQ